MKDIEALELGFSSFVMTGYGKPRDSEVSVKPAKKNNTHVA